MFWYRILFEGWAPRPRSRSKELVRQVGHRVREVRGGLAAARCEVAPSTETSGSQCLITIIIAINIKDDTNDNDNNSHSYCRTFGVDQASQSVRKHVVYDIRDNTSITLYTCELW